MQALLRNLHGSPGSHRLGWLAGALFCGNLLQAATPPADDANPTVPSATSTATVPAAAASSAVENSVVKIFSTVRNPDFGRPWTKATPTQISGSGVVIDGKRILTNAHVVHYASQIQVQAAHSGEKVSAKVEILATGIDLAILTLDDPAFFDTHPPLPRATKIPDPKDSVIVYGFPTGGTSLSVTKGIISRIEFASYNEGVAGLRIQIDAAINPGNSGGPAVVNDQMVGLAFSKLSAADNIGYIIPGEEIELFLKDIADGHYDGKWAMYDETQKLENSAMRQYLKLGPAQHGVMVAGPFNDNPDYPLKKWDVISKIGDRPIDDEGMINLGNDVRVSYRFFVQKIAQDAKVPLTIIRDGKEQNIQLPVGKFRPMLIPFLGDNYPSYYVFGPMVFTKATQEFVGRLGATSAQNALNFQTLLSTIGSPLALRRGDKPAFAGEELVVVTAPFFPHKLDVGYIQSPVSWVVKSVNGIAIKNLAHLVQVLNDSKDEYLRFEFAGRDVELFIFPRQAMKDSTEGVLTDNDIRAQGSADVLPTAAKAAN